MKEITIYKYEYDINKDSTIRLQEIPFILSNMADYDINPVIFGHYKHTRRKSNSNLIAIPINGIVLGKKLYMLERNDDYALKEFERYCKSSIISMQNRVRNLNKEIAKINDEIELYASKVDTICISEENKTAKA